MLACYQEKPPASNASTRASSGNAQLGLQPLPASHDTAIREIDRFQLTPEVLQRWTIAKRATDALHATNPEIEAKLKAETPPKTIDEAGKRFDGEPQMRAALAKGGMSGKEFLLTSIALQQAMKGYQLKTFGKLDTSKVPPVVMQNIIFVSTHLPQIMQSVGGVPAGGARTTP